MPCRTDCPNCGEAHGCSCRSPDDRPMSPSSVPIDWSPEPYSPPIRAPKRSQTSTEETIKKTDSERPQTKVFDIAGALCDVLTLLENQDIKVEIPADILGWRHDHEIKEWAKLEKRALEKLTPHEQRVLGLTKKPT